MITNTPVKAETTAIMTPSQVLTRPEPPPLDRGDVPFRVVETELRGIKVLMLEYAGNVLGPDGKVRRLPFRQMVGPDVPEPAPGTVDILGAAILGLLRQHQNLLDRYTIAQNDRDAALAKVEAVLKDKRKG